jgi:hypothetical protein
MYMKNWLPVIVDTMTRRTVETRLAAVSQQAAIEAHDKFPEWWNHGPRQTAEAALRRYAGDDASEEVIALQLGVTAYNAALCAEETYVMTRLVNTIEGMFPTFGGIREYMVAPLRVEKTGLLQWLHDSLEKCDINPRLLEAYFA